MSDAVVMLLQARTKVMYNNANPEWNEELRVGLTVSRLAYHEHWL